MKSQNKRMNSMPRANVTVKSLAKSPFQPLNNKTVNVLPVNKTWVIFPGDGSLVDVEMSGSARFIVSPRYQ